MMAREETTLTRLGDDGIIITTMMTMVDDDALHMILYCGLEVAIAQIVDRMHRHGELQILQSQVIGTNIPQWRTDSYVYLS